MLHNNTHCPFISLQSHTTMNSTYLVATTVTQENILETCTNSTQNHRLGQRLKLKDLAQVQDGDNAAV